MSRMEHNQITTMPSVLFREIHKNGCLKRYSSERRAGFPRKTDKVWAVFCVHDDTEAFLEFYSDHKAALSHKPEWFVSLRNALHISPSICGQAEEFEFAVTLPSQVIRLAASSWDSMMEWVDTLRNKLRELRVLAPKENFYSKMPEPRHMLLPTRDPTSPLPLPPVGATGLVPGVENPSRQLNLPTNSEQLTETQTLNQMDNQNDFVPSNASRNETVVAMPSLNTSVVNTELLLEQLRTESPPLPCSSKSCKDRKLSKNSSKNSHVSSTELRSSSTQEEQNISCLNVSDVSGISSIVVINADTASASSSTVHVEGNEVTHESVERSAHISSTSNTSNVTVIEVPPPMSPHYEHLFIPEDSQMLSDSRVKLERVSSTGLIPRVPSRVSREGEVRPKINSPSRIRDRAKATSPDLSSTSNSCGEPPLSLSGVQLKAAHKKEKSVIKVLPMNSVSVISVPNGPSSIQSHQSVPPIPAAFQPTSSLVLEVRDIPLIGGHQRRRRRSSSGDAGPSQRIIGGADLIRSAAAEAPETNADAPRLTLRESQVNQLRREMDHPGGVRLPLKRKDCSGAAIALVDVANSVWVAGWKQREHPMLYNALHIGDELVSISDVPVRSAMEAQRLLKGPSGPAVELVVKRLPRGKVLTLQRPRGGGDVGLLPDPNSACEVNVVPGGAAAQSGLSSCTPTMDGLSLTTWSITEINGRPLNLFCKPADVTTRLNSVGRELSVLVQPSDFIRQLRKQLKYLRNYKDYLLQ